MRPSVAPPRSERPQARTILAVFRLDGARLPVPLASRVRPLYSVGQFDNAIMQAFEEGSRSSCVAAGGYTDSDYGPPLMRKAFDPNNGPLTELLRCCGRTRGPGRAFRRRYGLRKEPAQPSQCWHRRPQRGVGVDPIREPPAAPCRKSNAHALDLARFKAHARDRRPLIGSAPAVHRQSPTAPIGGDPSRAGRASGGLPGPQLLLDRGSQFFPGKS